MPYDKRSFLAGISVGTQLKGWGAYPSELVQRLSMKATRLKTSPVKTAELLAVGIGNYRQLYTPGLILIHTFEEV